MATGACATTDFNNLCRPNPIKITQGETRTLNLTIVKDETCNEPFDITGVSEIVIQLPGTLDTVEKKKTLNEVTVISAERGNISTDLSAVDTEALKIGNESDFQVVLTIGTDIRIAKFIDSLTVEASLF